MRSRRERERERETDRNLFPFSLSLSSSSCFLNASLSLARFAFIPPESRTRQGEAILPLSVSLFCDLISARIKHRRTDVYLSPLQKKPSARTIHGAKRGDLLNYARGLFRPSHCGFRATKVATSLVLVLAPWNSRDERISATSRINLNKNAL